MRPLLRLVPLALLLACTPAPDAAQPTPDPAPALTPAQQRAQNVTITRDDWGIAHIHGRTDADAIFGMMYAQAEDDFNRIETNFINAMGRLAEAEGESAIFQDLRMKLFIDPELLRKQYADSPAWLRELMDAWADGLNYYLQTHPDVQPRVITRFEPWMALSFSEGSIGGDIERISIDELGAFYGARVIAAPPDPEPGGSNGFAIAPHISKSRHALLLINPHTSFFFRAEQQVQSDEGLNVYGASTWGQFFVYQGFNERLGWMHTSSGVDNVDEFAETIVERDGRYFYRYGDEERPLITQTITVPYRTPDGTIAQKAFTVYRTHHGPIVREQDGKWISVALMHRPVEALMQSFSRTKARNFSEYMQIMELCANSSNNTIYADADGTIAYLHPQFIPRRDDRFVYTQVVDGSDPATDWQGDHALSELPFVRNPSVGWIQNTNNWPYTAAGSESPSFTQFPHYMDTAGENARGLHALMVLANKRDFTLESLRDAAYDPYLPEFEQTLPSLLAAYDALPRKAPLRAQLAEPIAELRSWDYRWGASSIATSLAVFWGEAILRQAGYEEPRPGMPAFAMLVDNATAEQRLSALLAATTQLAADFGDWRTAWGEINRFQRLTGDIVHPFDDSGASVPVAFTSALWGSLASFGARTYPGTKRRYGTRGNSFVAVVEFGDRVRALAVSAGGQSGHPESAHFNDQAEPYATGNLREVYFYPSQLEGHTERVYRPGQ
jgi:acyl-homoserine-lactone acylase